jgi:hypothetical protein
LECRSEESRLRNYLSLSNPDLSTREVDHLYNKSTTQKDLTRKTTREFEITERTINIKTDLKTLFFKNVREFNAEGGSDEHIPLTL